MSKNRFSFDRRNTDAKKPTCDTHYVTIFTDASFCPETKAYGCAYWIKHSPNVEPLLNSFGGVGIQNIGKAETLAIEEAVKAAEEFIEIDSVVVIQSDSTEALSQVNLTQLRASCKFVKLKHVKAHTDQRTKRTSVNRIVDKLARKAMQSYRP